MDTVIKKESQGGYYQFPGQRNQQNRWVGIFILIFQQVWWPLPGQGQVRTSMHSVEIIHPFDKCLLSFYFVPHPGLGMEDNQ